MSGPHILEAGTESYSCNLEAKNPKVTMFNETWKPNAKGQKELI